MKGRNLEHKPLVEAILELKWELPAQTLPNMEVDPHYRLLLGRFSERVENDYPFHEPLPTTQIPDALAAYMAQHRFRVSEGGWPLVQIGPGLMTVNETTRYTWVDFKARCERAVSDLFGAHPAKQSFKVQDLTLRYIDAIETDLEREDLFAFLRDKLKTGISLPDSLFEDGQVRKNPAAFIWQVSFPHDDPGGLITLRFATGKHDDRPALVWETLVQTPRDRVPQIPDKFPDWLKKAHDLIEDWFFKIIEGELERRFS